MSKGSSGKNGGGSKGSGGKSGGNPNWPSKTSHQVSGKGRGNNPPKSKRG